MVTIKDVAKKAGVSFKTVSRVINNDAAVHPDTKEKVLEAIRDLNYYPNIIARGLRTKKTNTIGFISDEIGASRYGGQMLKGAQEQAWEHGIVLLSLDTNSDEKRKRESVEVLLSRKVDGLIYAAMYHREVHPPKTVSTLPFVLLDCYMKENTAPSITPDEFLGGYTATKHLLEKGYRDIGFVNVDMPTPANFGRLKGYKQALTEYSVDFDPTYVSENPAEISGGYEGTMALMSLGKRPKAIFCFNDRMAVGAYQAAHELGLRIPDDLAVVGFDDELGVASMLRPPLTSLALPHYEMGKWAVNQLIELIDAETRTETVYSEPYLLECPLVVRSSA